MFCAPNGITRTAKVNSPAPEHLFRDRNRAGHPEYTSRAEWRVPHAKGRFHYQNRSSAGYHRPITSRPAPACPLNSGSNFRFEGPENGESTNFRTVHSFSARAFSSRVFLPGGTSGRSDGWRRRLLCRGYGPDSCIAFGRNRGRTEAAGLASHPALAGWRCQSVRNVGPKAWSQNRRTIPRDSDERDRRSYQ